MINIIRKFFASILFSIFVFIMPPLFILSSIDAVFLNKSFVDENLIPQSYEPVTGLVAEQFAENPQDTSLFAKRIRRALSGNSYSELMRRASGTFFNTLGQFKDKQTISLDFSDLKSELKERLPEIIKNMEECGESELKSEGLRFCKPPVTIPDYNFEETVSRGLDKVIHGNTVIGDEKLASIKDYIEIAILAKDNLAFIIFVVGSSLILMMSLLIFSPLSSVLKWIGSALISLTLLMALFLFSVSRLPEVVPIFEGLSVAQIALIIFAVKQLAAKLLLYTFFVGGSGILFSGCGFILGLSRKGKSD